MAITDYKITPEQIAANGVVAAPDMLTGTAQENKSVFDRLVRETVAPNLNAMLDELADSNGEMNAAEQERQTQETARQAAEQERQTQETARQAAEAAREDTHTGTLARAQDAAAAAEEARDIAIARAAEAATDARNAGTRAANAELHEVEASNWAEQARIYRNAAAESSAAASAAAAAVEGLDVYKGTTPPTHGEKIWLCPTDDPIVLCPDRATSSMTQPVGVDADGKLWCAPGGGGESGWKLIIDTTLTEAATFTTGEHPDASEVIVQLAVPDPGTGGNISSANGFTLFGGMIYYAFLGMANAGGITYAHAVKVGNTVRGFYFIGKTTTTTLGFGIPFQTNASINHVVEGRTTNNIPASCMVELPAGTQIRVAVK